MGLIELKASLPPSAEVWRLGVGSLCDKGAARVPADLRITPARHTDYEQLVTLLRTCFPGRTFGVEWVRENLVDSIDVYDTFVALAGGGKVIATVSARRRCGVGEIAWVACRPDYRRRGITRLLVAAAFACLASNGYTGAVAVLNPPTDESRTFWTSIGAEPI